MKMTYIVVALIIGASILGYGWMSNETKQKQLDYTAQQEQKKQEISSYCAKITFEAMQNVGMPSSALEAQRAYDLFFKQCLQSRGL